MATKQKRKRAHNKGKIVGAKPALTPEHVQAIRVILAESGVLRDQVLFALAIDSCLRGCDLVKLTVGDVALSGIVRGKVQVRPTKTKDSTGAIVTFEPTKDTRTLLGRYIDAEGLTAGDVLFSRIDRTLTRSPISDRAYLDLVKKWVKKVGLDPQQYGTHSLRRSRPAFIYAKTGNLRACQIMLGHKSIISTQRYLGIEEEETLEIARRFAL